MLQKLYPGLSSSPVYTSSMFTLYSSSSGTLKHLKKLAGAATAPTTLPVMSLVSARRASTQGKTQSPSTSPSLCFSRQWQPV